MIITDEFELAFRYVTETNQNIFLTGKAGTGKTTFLKYLRDNCAKKMVVAAPTGVAAINARGVTLHSLFQLPFGIILPQQNSEDEEGGNKHKHPLLSKIHYTSEKLDLLRSMDLLVIDEVSMVTCYIIDAIDIILRYVRRSKHQPFGGVQILFIGDLYQLPPVVKREEWEILQEFYSSIFFFDSFVLRENIPVIIELKEIFRQKDDNFIEILNGIRNNNITEEEFELLNSRLNRNFNPDDDEGFITLTTHNYQSDEINKNKLNNLTTPEFIFTAEINGEFPEHTYPSEKELKLKCGAQVMFLKNDNEGKQYFNGKIGIITELDENNIKVKCKDESWDIEVKKCEWQNVSYKVHPDTREIKEEILGKFTQIPLRLSWANTIHKSQGLTFDRIIIDAEKAFAMGQVYVALSRCTSLEGLVLRSPVYRKYLGAHGHLKEWQYNNSGLNASDRFIESRQNYSMQEVQNIFTWKRWYYALKELYQVFLENHTTEENSKISFDSIRWIKELLEKQKEIYDVSEKFKQVLVKFYRDNPAIEEQEQFQKRLKDGANYFYDEIRKWKEELYNHPVTVNTVQLSRKIDALLYEINLITHENLYRIECVKDGFVLNKYLSAVKSFRTRGIKQVSSSLISNKISNVSTFDLPNPELFEKLKELREHLLNRDDVPSFLVPGVNTLKNICASLPCNIGELKKVKGLGLDKTGLCGEEIVSIVKQYCYENSITGNITYKKVKVNTVEETIKLFKKGLSVEEIAKERHLTPTSIDGHLAKAITDNIVDVHDVIDFEELMEISDQLPTDPENYTLSQLKEKLPADVTYGKLKLTLAWLKKKER